MGGETSDARKRREEREAGEVVRLDSIRKTVVVRWQLGDDLTEDEIDQLVPGLVANARSQAEEGGLQIVGDPDVQIVETDVLELFRGPDTFRRTLKITHRGIRR